MTDYLHAIDRVILEMNDGKNEYNFLLSQVEKIINDHLDTEGVQKRSISIQYILNNEDELSQQLMTSMRAFVLIQALKAWERDASKLPAETFVLFRRAVCAALNIGLYSTVLSPLVSDLEKDQAKQQVGRAKGGAARAAAFKQYDESLEAALKACWQRGDRHTKLKEWSDAITALAPELKPDKQTNFDKINRKIGLLGRRIYGSEWPIRAKRSS